MNTCMYEHPLTEMQLNQLKTWGVHVIEPIEKRLACGDIGKLIVMRIISRKRWSSSS